MGRKERIDMRGVRFGRLVGLKVAHKDQHGNCYWVFACDCGTEIVAHGGNVRKGNTTSCGCRRRELSVARLLTHGERAEKHHGPTYRAWQTMKSSCYNPHYAAHSRLGGRGIRVCDRWRDDYPTFLADMGRQPSGTVLKRTDIGADFGPGNCIRMQRAAGKTCANDERLHPIGRASEDSDLEKRTGDVWSEGDPLPISAHRSRSST